MQFFTSLSCHLFTNIIENLSEQVLFIATTLPSQITMQISFENRNQFQMILEIKNLRLTLYNSNFEKKEALFLKTRQLFRRDLKIVLELPPRFLKDCLRLLKDF
jgi:hypothetical protein